MAPTFQDIILTLHGYWSRQGALIVMPYDTEKGAGTLNPHTFLRALGPEPWRAAYVEPSRRPTDGRYGKNPFRLQHYYQYQCVLKPAPANAQELYEGSLRELGIDTALHDLRYVEDDWEQATFGCAGLGWEVWLDGMEVSQFTYFQQVGGLEVDPVTFEITYGLERIAMFLQGVDSVFDLAWGHGVTYADLHLETERQCSRYNFEEADVELHRRRFEEHYGEAYRLLSFHSEDEKDSLVYPAYDYLLKASHSFNLLHARGALSVAQRAEYVDRIRRLAGTLAQVVVRQREALGHPLLRHQHAEETA
ncbi:MAG: glycine--tRNA ligase subunit alpha [Planctomycetota bacterium]|nr:MAG: glycine--tRNA ligase subunit alpha [Planctomycetota bacterium]